MPDARAAEIVEDRVSITHLSASFRHLLYECPTDFHDGRHYSLAEVTVQVVYAIPA